MDLVVPVKRLVAAKSRLRDPTGDPIGHTRLALAFTLDTVAAARTAHRVRTVLVVTADRTVAATLVASGIEVADDPLVGLNAAYDRGARLLRGIGGGRALRDDRAVAAEGILRGERAHDTAQSAKHEREEDQQPQERARALNPRREGARRGGGGRAGERGGHGVRSLA